MTGDKRCDIYMGSWNCPREFVLEVEQWGSISTYETPRFKEWTQLLYYGQLLVGSNGTITVCLVLVALVGLPEGCLGLSALTEKCGSEHDVVV